MLIPAAASTILDAVSDVDAKARMRTDKTGRPITLLSSWSLLRGVDTR